MITVSNALVSALAYLQAQQAGHTIKMPAAAANGVDLPAWCEKHGLSFAISGGKLTLQLRQDGPGYQPPDPRIPAPGTPIEKLHPGNRFRVMFGQSLLPQESVDFRDGGSP